MKPIKEFKTAIQFLFTDIDDTLTEDGLLGPEAYKALWNLKQAGIHVIPVTGRPAGWCEMIARLWPVQGVVGENGAFYFRYVEKKMKRHFFLDEKTRLLNQKKLRSIESEILQKIPAAAVASDQFCRLFDLAIDFCEDIPALPKSDVQKIVKIFTESGAQAKISSIHVNGWFGQYNKLTMVLKYLEEEWKLSPDRAKLIAGFSGDSPNDEPMFAYFPHSFGVANIKDFVSELKDPPHFVTINKGGSGFVEIAEALIANFSKK